MLTHLQVPLQWLTTVFNEHELAAGSMNTLSCVDVSDMLAECGYFAVPSWALPCRLPDANVPASAAMSARGTRTPTKKKLQKA